MAPGGQRIGLRSAGSNSVNTGISNETRTVISTGGLRSDFCLVGSPPMSTDISNETNKVIAPGGLRSYIDELLANSHHVLGSHHVKTNISKETKLGGLHSEGSKSITTTENVDGSHWVKTNISKENKSEICPSSPFTIARRNHGDRPSRVSPLKQARTSVAESSTFKKPRRRAM